MIFISDKNRGLSENAVLKLLHEMTENMKYGSITIIIQDGKVVQIEKSEKIRI